MVSHQCVAHPSQGELAIGPARLIGVSFSHRAESPNLGMKGIH
jgi:hypothetical protein